MRITFLKEITHVIVPYSLIGMHYKKPYFFVAELISQCPSTNVDVMVKPLETDSPFYETNSLLDFSYRGDLIYSVKYNDVYFTTKEEAIKITKGNFNSLEYIRTTLFHNNVLVPYKILPKIFNKSFYTLNKKELFDNLSKHKANLPCDESKKFIV
jgi:hypothetical protein